MFRNREIRQFSVVFFGVTIISVIVGFYIHRTAGILMLIAAAAYGAAFLIFTKQRYRSLVKMAEEIDRVLHNEEHIYLEDQREGELSILQSEIGKMTLRIREQNTALKNEKEYLADSLADIAHQLRTPLTSLTLLMSLLKKKPEERKRRELLHESEELLAQMDWLVTSLLKISRLDAGIVTFQKEIFSVEELVSVAVHPFFIAMELHEITLETKIPKTAVLNADKGWLCEAVQNILKNCMEHTKDHGTIEICCEDNLLFTELCIRDDGNGFDKEELPHLFERFYRGKQDGASGYGIGLALCKNIILRQGGTVTAKNHPKGGAVFVIRFQK